MKLPGIAWVVLVLIALASCNNKPPATKPQTTTGTANDSASKKEETPEPLTITYHALVKKDSLRKEINKIYTPEQRYIIYALNRVDAGNSKRPDTLIVPDTLIADMNVYSPFPAEVPFLKDVNRMVYFSYPIQAFAAYDHGKLVHWGPTSMGKKSTRTPTGLFFSNWKSKETISTVSDEWKLKWNFNISNRGGVGWHQYAMPGYPASHSCLRMLEADAKYMYEWADQWVLQGSDNLLANGTPTLVFGEYPFGQPRPWFALLADPKANMITVEALQKETESFLPKIMAEQEKRAGVVAASTPVVTDTLATPDSTRKSK